MRFKDQIYFVLERNSNPTYSFTGYSDSETGVLKQIFKGRKDPKTGADLPHRFKFDRAHRSIRVHKDEKDIYGNSVVEHLRGFPSCKDSPNGSYQDDGKGGKTQSDVWFTEVKDHDDAVTAIEAKAIQLEAGNIALNLNGSELREIAAIYEMFDDDEAKQKHRILEEAAADPAKFMKIYNSEERAAKALLSRAVKAGIIEISGTIYTWKGKTIGVTRELAISKLITNTDIAEALEEKLKSTGNG